MRRFLIPVLVAALTVSGCSAVQSGGAAQVEPDIAPELGFVEASSEPTASDSADAPLRIGLVGSPNFDPVEVTETDASAMFLADVLYDGLTEMDPTSGTTVPALAEHWIVSPDGRSWTFILRDDATFSDGSPITSAAVKGSIERVRARGAAGVTSAALDVVVGIELIDDRTLVLQLSEPFAALRELLASPVMGIVAPGGPFDAWSGSYGVTDEDRRTIRLEATDVDAGIASFEVWIYPDAPAAAAALAAGEIDVAPLAPASRATVLDSGASIVSDDVGASVFYGMNIAHPALVNPLFRAAIARTIDRNAIAALRGDANVVASDHVAGMPCGDACAHDPDFAFELLEVAYPDGDYPVVPIDYFIDDDGVEEMLAAEVARQLTTVGIRTELRGAAFEDYAAVVTAGDHGLFRFGAVRGYASPVAELVGYTSTSPVNVTGFANADYDEAMAQVIEGDPSAQVQAGEILANASVVLPMVQYQSVFAVSERVSGLVLNDYGTFDVTSLRVAVG